jgi:hypothetical protein
MSYATRPATPARRVVVPTLAAARHRDVVPAREFGTGYGNSSGYASQKRYVRDSGNARFRFA